MDDPISLKEMKRLMFAAAYAGNFDAVRRWLEAGVDIDTVESLTGLSPLHVAIGRNHVDLVRFLLHEGATVQPDESGRWPSTIAELCEADGEICDLIVDAESKLSIV